MSCVLCKRIVTVLVAELKSDDPLISVSKAASSSISPG